MTFSCLSFLPGLSYKVYFQNCVDSGIATVVANQPNNFFKIRNDDRLNLVLKTMK
jgi:hypothetical protein